MHRVNILLISRRRPRHVHRSGHSTRICSLPEIQGDRHHLAGIFGCSGHDDYYCTSLAFGQLLFMLWGQPFDPLINNLEETQNRLFWNRRPCQQNYQVYDCFHSSFLVRLMQLPCSDCSDRVDNGGVRNCRPNSLPRFRESFAVNYPTEAHGVTWYSLSSSSSHPACIWYLISLCQSSTQIRSCQVLIREQGGSMDLDLLVALTRPRIAVGWRLQELWISEVIRAGGYVGLIDSEFLRY